MQFCWSWLGFWSAILHVVSVRNLDHSTAWPSRCCCKQTHTEHDDEQICRCYLTNRLLCRPSLAAATAFAFECLNVSMWHWDSASPAAQLSCFTYALWTFSSWRDNSSSSQFSCDVWMSWPQWSAQLELWLFRGWLNRGSWSNSSAYMLSKRCT